MKSFLATFALVGSFFTQSMLYSEVFEGVEYLYWRPHQGGLAFTDAPSPVETTLDFTQTARKYPHFEWGNGFRLFQQADFCGETAINVSWTHFFGSAKGFQTTVGQIPPLGSYPAWWISNNALISDYATTSDFHWKLRLDYGDIDFKQEWACDFPLTVFFSWGLRTAFIRQHVRADYTGGTFLDVLNKNSFKNNYWGVGPKFELGGTYILCDCIGVRGSVGTSLLTGSFHNTYQNVFNTTTIAKLSRYRTRFVPSLDYSVGFESLVNICGVCADFLLAVKWEGHYFYQQFHYHTGLFDISKRQKTLSVNGLTVELGVRF